jgi:hypothetical protein
MWPWNRQRAEAEKARQEFIEAQRKAKAAEERRKAVDRLIGRSMATSARLRREVERNGFSDLLQQAWGAR